MIDIENVKIWRSNEWVNDRKKKNEKISTSWIAIITIIVIVVVITIIIIIIFIFVIIALSATDSQKFNIWFFYENVINFQVETNNNNNKTLNY